MSPRLLALHENLEDIRDELSARLQRPVYIASCIWESCAKALLPDKTEAQELTEFQKFMLPYEYDHSKETAVARVAPYTRIAIPLLPGDGPLRHREKYPPYHDPDAYVRNALETVRLHADINSRRHVRLRDLEVCPKELTNFARIQKGPDGKLRNGVVFGWSEPIMRPIRTEQRWHLGEMAQSTKGIVRPLLPPGHYSDVHVNEHTDFNHLGVTDVDPGPCVACRGKTGIRRHFGVRGHHHHTYGPSMTNLICVVCLQHAASQLASLVDESEPT